MSFSSEETKVPPLKDLKLVIFDCDGVLVGGESSSNVLMAEEARKYGWNLSNEDAIHEFSGGELASIGHKIAEKTGKKLPEGWDVQMEHKIADMMRQTAETVDGAPEMLKAIQAMGVPTRVGTNSSGTEMDAKFEATKLNRFFSKDRIHSGRDLGTPKPRPEVYLYAAHQEGVKPDECLVVEDSDAGALAAHRAGMQCILLRDAGKPMPKWDGIHRISHLSELPEIVRKYLKK